MESKQNLLIAEIVCVILGIGLIIWLALPNSSQIKNQESKISTIDEEALSSSVLKNIQEKANKGELVQFGNIPVTVDKSTQGKENPFAK